MMQFGALAILAVFAWRVGTARSAGGFLIAAIYTLVSLIAWRAPTPYLQQILFAAHVTGALVCLLYSTTMGGQLMGLVFVALIGLDALAFYGVVEFERAKGVWWDGAYADWKGLAYYGILLFAGLGISGRNRFQPILGLHRFSGDGHHAWPLRVEADQKATRSGSG